MSDKQQQRTKATVFISYAREDENFVRVLRSALQDRGFEVKGDWLLTTGDDYAKRLRDFNLEAHAFIFLISPDSIKSEACRNELTHAVEHKKQILPISHRNHGDDNLLDSALRSPHWTMLRAGDDFESGIENLVSALNTDFALMDIHSRLLVAADNWSNHGRNRSYLWRKDGLKSAESWLAVTSAQPDKLPQPTPLQIEFIFAGQRARSRGTRIGFGIVLGVAAALTFVSIVALAQRSRAISNAEDANTQRQTAEKNAKEADRQAGIATEKAAEAERQRQQAEKNAKEAERQAGIAKTNEQAARTQQRLAEERRVEAERQRLLVKKSFVDSQLALGTALIKEGRMAEGLWSYWLAYENTTPEDPARESALKLIGSWSQLAGRPLVLDNGLREVKFSRDEKSVLTITDRAAQLWDIETGEPIGEKIAASDAPWQAMAVSTDASTLVVANNSSAEVWDTQTGKRRVEPLSHGEKISWVAFSADGTTFFTQGKRLFRFWNAKTGQKYAEDIQIDRDHYYAILAPDGKSAFLGFVDPRLLNLSSGESTNVPFGPHPDRRNDLAKFSPDGRILIAAGNTVEELRDYQFAEAWMVGSDKPLNGSISHRGSFTAITFSSDSRNFLTGGDDNTAYVWYVSDNEIKRLGPPLYHGGSVVSGAFSDTRAIPTILTGSTDKTARLWRVWNLQTILPKAYPFRHGGSVDSVAMSADGRTLLTGSSDGIARLWNPYLRDRASDSESNAVVNRSDGDKPILEAEKLKAVLQHEPAASVAAISHDKSVAAIQGEDNTVRLRLVSNGELVGKPLRHRATVLAVSFSPDGRLVATGSADNTATIWDTTTGVVVGRTLTHDDAVNSVEFSPDGSTLLTASGDTKARFWDVASGALLGDPLLHSYKVQLAKYVSDGHGIVTRASGAEWYENGSWNVSTPAADKPECLRLSLEWRTGYRLDSTQRISRLTQSEWLASKRTLDALGEPCDVVR